MKRLALTAAILAVSAAAMAQGPGGGQGGPGRGGFPGGQRGGFGGPGRDGFQGGPGGPMMNRQVSASTLSLKALVTYLGLSDVQVGKIALAREESQEAMRPPMGQRGGQNGERPRFENMQTRMQTAERKASNAIAALLTEPQKAKLATLVKALQALQSAGVRPDAAVKLQLTEEQLAKLAGGASAEQVLDNDQQATAESYRMPQGGPGGPPRGGFGGPDGGGPGGPPPEFGGPDGPEGPGGPPPGP